MKQIRVFVILAALCLILPVMSYAQDHRHSRSAEIRIINNTDTQITLRIFSEKYGSKKYVYAPGESGILTTGGIRLRVRGNDQVEIADWGKAFIQDVSAFEDGLWNLSIRQARRMMRNNEGAGAEQFYNEGMALKEQNDYAGAIIAFSKAIELKPDYASAFFFRGSCYDAQKNYDRAIQDLSSAIKLRPDDANAYSMRGNIYLYNKNNYDRAIRDFNKSIEFRTDNANTYDSRGLAKERMGDYNGALQDYESALSIDPNNKYAKPHLSKLRIKMRESSR